MKKNISITKFIIIELIIMVLIFIAYASIYLSVLPSLKVKCYPEVYNISNACQKAHKCDCSSGSNCTCQYKNFKGEETALGCPNEKSPCENAIKCNCNKGDNCTCQHNNKEQQLVCPIEDINK